MDEVIARTEVFASPTTVFSFLMDFPGYAKYSTYLDEVQQIGDGGEGTQYRLHLSWWKLTYRITTEVTSIDPPTTIHWRTRSTIEASGHWAVEPIETVEGDYHSRVTLHIAYDTDSASLGGLDIPRFVSPGWVIDRVKPLVVPEAERIVERIVTDLEGEPRSIDLEIETRST